MLVENWMHRNVITVDVGDSMMDASRILKEHNIGKKGIQFAFLLEDRPGSIKEVTDIIRKYRGRMMSILSSYEQAQEGFRRVYIRFHDADRERLSELKEELKRTAKVLYMVDHGENKREIYVG